MSNWDGAAFDAYLTNQDRWQGTDDENDAEELPRERYPDITVQLSGMSGNAAGIIGRTQRALERAGVTEAEIDQFTNEATSGDYDHVIQTVMRWVGVQ